MDHTALIPEVKEEGVETQAATLSEVCHQIVVRRAARGKRYELATLFVLLIVAKLVGMQSV
jgi:hypothetical protein